MKNNPMQSGLPMHRSPRCGAKTRSGLSCRAPAMPNGRCRMHGGTSTGAPAGNKNAIKHLVYTRAEIHRRDTILKMVRRAKALAQGREE